MSLEVILKCSFYPRRVLVIFSLLGLSGGVSVQFNRQTYWYGGFVGEACFTAPSNLDGWSIGIIFGVDVQQLEEVWNGVLERKVNDRYYIIKDVYYNTNPEQGALVCPGFKGKTNHDIPTTATVEFISNGGNQGVLPVTDAPTTIVTDPVTASLPPTSDGTYDYDSVLRMSILFYEAQRSGKLPANNRIPWRGDSAVNDRGHDGEDLSGGWYDAGDYVKFNLPMAASTTILLWGLDRFKDAYISTGELNNMYNSVRWPLDYFLKCWIPEKNYYYYQVGDPVVDHAYWGRPEDMTMNRPAYKVTASSGGSDVAGDTAAALAAGSIVFKTEDSAYSAELLDAAKSLYTFAKTYKSKYPLDDFYVSSGYDDELCVAAMWLYKATGQNSYLSDAQSFVSNQIPWAFSWDNKMAACQLLLFEETGQYQNEIVNFLDTWVNGNIETTPCGLSFRDTWGSLRYSANTAFLALLAAEDGLKPTTYREWAVGQINYMLGDNKLGLSYVIGYSNNYPTKPHHASSSCPVPPETCSWDIYNSNDPNTHILYGALVGGPDKYDNYVDDRTKYEHTEVACDYNAGFQSSIAGLIKLEDNGNLPDGPARNC